MTRIGLAAMCSATLLAGCVPKATVLPDRCLPHRLAKPARVEVWVRRADGALIRQTIEAGEGWWLAAPEAVEGCQR